MLEQKINTTRITEAIKRTVAVVIVSAIAAGAAACGDDTPDKCTKMASALNKGYATTPTYQSTYKNQQYLSEATCPSGCDLIGETEDQYCCWCPDE